MELKIIPEPSASLHLLASYRVQRPPRKYDLFRIALFFDEISDFSLEKSELDFLGIEPYGVFSNKAEEILEKVSEIEPPNEQDIANLLRIFDEPTDGGDYAYLLIRGILRYAQENNYYFYSFPGHREGFLRFCSEYEPDYLEMMKKSFLLNSILEFIFDAEIPSFDPESSKELLKNFTSFKQDFQQGILQFVDNFSGNYRLSEEQKNYIKLKIATDEQQLLEFLKPENLRKYISKAEIGTEVVSYISAPIGILIKIGGKIKTIVDFKNKNLNFILSLFTLKKISNLLAPTELPECVVCSLSMTEIENMSEKNCEEMLLDSSTKMCVEHMVAYLDLRKRYNLWGKPLLDAMKNFVAPYYLLL